jgi:hypothetical protein
MLIILATQEGEIRRISVQSQPRQIVPGDSISKNSFTKKIGLVEWLKVKALSSSPSTAKKKKGIPMSIFDMKTHYPKCSKI